MSRIPTRDHSTGGTALVSGVLNLGDRTKNEVTEVVNTFSGEAFAFEYRVVATFVRNLYVNVKDEWVLVER